jgi:hypothetical protein
VSDTPLTDAAKEGGESWMELAALSAVLERENAALRELLNEPYQFFRFGHKSLEPWGEALDEWCERAEKLGFNKEAQP